MTAGLARRRFLRSGRGAAVVAMLAMVLSMVTALVPGAVLTASAATNDNFAPGSVGAAHNTFYVYAKEGETLRVQPGVGVESPGYQDLKLTTTVVSPSGGQQQLAGPLTQTITASNAGVWTVVVHGTQVNTSTGALSTLEPRYTWDIAIADSSGAELSGRIWLDSYEMLDNKLVDLDFYVINDTGYAYHVRADDYYGVYSMLMANSVGWSDESCAPTYKSFSTDLTTAEFFERYVQPPDCGEWFRLFLDEPAADLPEKATYWGYETDGDQVRTFYQRTTWVSPEPLTSQELMSSVAMTYEPTGHGPAGTFTYSLDARFSGGYAFQIDVNGNGSYSDPVDVNTTLGAPAQDASNAATRTYTYEFDGLDGRGNPVDATVLESARLYFDKIGEVHFLQRDVEGREQGIEVTSLVDGSTTLYWDDRELPGTRTTAVSQEDGTAGVNSAGGVHSWPFAANGWGNDRWIDDWTYTEIEAPSATVYFGQTGLDVSKTSNVNASPRVGDTFSYTVTGTNTSGVDYPVENPANITDDLSTVLDDGTLGTITATVDGADMSQYLTLDGSTLTWRGPLKSGKSVVITVPVTITGAGDGQMNNVAWSVPPTVDPGVTPPTCDGTATVDCTEVLLPHLSVSKTASSANPAVGETVTYTVDVTSTGPGAYTAARPATMTDDLSGVLDDATLVTGSLSSSVGNAPTVSGGVLSWSGALAAGQTATITYQVTYHGGGDKAMVNTACIPASEASGEACSTSTGVGQSAAGLTLAKTSDASGQVELGAQITYSFEVTNTGNVPVSNIVVEDPKLGGAITCPVTELAPGASTTCTSSPYTVTEADLLSGAVSNSASVDGEAPGGVDPTDPGTATETTDTAEPVGSSSMTKTATWANDANGNGLADAGDTISYAFVVTNTGNVTLTDLRINDPKLSGITITCPATELAPGASTTCTSASPYTVTQQDVIDGEVANSATAESSLPDGATDGGEGTDTTTTPTAVAGPALSLTKSFTLSGDDAVADLGEQILFTFTVTNNGNISIADVAVDDPMLTAAGIGTVCAQTTLDPGQQTTCTAQAPYVVTEADILAGGVANTASVGGSTPEGVDPLDPGTGGVTVPTAPAQGSFEVEKSGTLSGGDTVAGLGEQVNYTFTVTNTGNVTVTDVAVVDPKLTAAGVAVTCPVTELAPGASTTCSSAAYTVTEADLTAGTVANSATATGTTPEGVGPSTSGEGENEIPTEVASGGLALVKTGALADTNGNGLADAGETITYSFLITNTGNVTITDVAVSDPKLPANAVTCPVTELAPGANTTCTSTPYTVTEADVIAGSVSNSATVSGTGPTGPAVPGEGGTEEPTVTAAGSLELTKSARLIEQDGDGIAKAGDGVAYTFTIRNTGNVTMSDVAVDDPKLAAVGIGVTCAATTLAPGASTNCAADAVYTVTEADIAAGGVYNAATAPGTVPDGVDTNEPGIDEVTVPTETARGSLSAVKKATLHDLDGNGLADAGESIGYEVTVTNTGNVTMSGITVDDPMLAAAGIAVVCPADTLAPAGSMVCTSQADYVVTEADVLAGGVTNVVSVAGTAPEGVDPDDPGTDTETTPTAAVGASLAMTKSATLADANGNGTADAGETLRWTFDVVNNGNVTVSDVRVEDPMLAAAGIGITCPVSELAPGERTNCTSDADYTVTEADILAGGITNAATATGTVPDGGGEVNPGTDTETTPTTTADGRLTMTKTATLNDEITADGKAEAGETINYAFTLVNAGNVTVSDVRVDDPMLAVAGIGVTCPVASLGSGASTTCSADAGYTVTESDIIAGGVVNAATATGSTPDGVELTPGTDGEETDTVSVNSELSMTKSAEVVDGAAPVGLGDQIRYTFTVTNSGNVTIADVAVADPMLTAAGIGVSCAQLTLAPGASTECVADALYTVTEADLLAGTVSNTATAGGSSPEGVTVDPTPGEDGIDVPTTEAAARLLIDKQSVLEDANGNGTAEAGELVWYSFAVSNPGSVTITDVAVDDPKLATAGIGITCPVTVLAPGEFTTCTADAPYVVTEADVIAGGVRNHASVTGNGPDGSGETDGGGGDENEIPTLEPAGALGLDKQAALADTNGNGLADAGESIAYTFTATNTGNVTITDVAVADPMLADAGIAVVCESTTLTPGESTLCAAATPYVVTEQDVIDGAVVNQATAGGSTPDGVGETSEGTDGTRTPTPVAGPSWTLTKEARLDDVAPANGTADAGESIWYTFEVVNNGNVTVDGIAVADPMLADAGIGITCPTTTLAPGERTVCAADAAYVVTEADVIAGGVTNTASVPGSVPEGVTEPEEPTDEVDVPTTVATASLRMVKDAVLDDSDGDGLAGLGESVRYSFTVTNDGNVTITDVAVDDPKLAEAGIGVSCPVTALAPGESTTCVADADYVVTETDLLDGGVANVATVTGTGPEEVDPTDPGEGTKEIPSEETSGSLTMDKQATLSDANGNGTADAGESIDYAFVVTNSGNVTITDVRITDEMLSAAGIGILCDPTTLAPGESVTCTGERSYVVTEADVVAGGVVNTASVTGTGPDGVDETIPGEDTEVIETTDARGGFSMTKSGGLVDRNDNGVADLGESIVYTFEVVNTGNVTVSDIAIDDPMLVLAGLDVVCEQTTLAPGGSTTCESEPYLVTESDLIAGSVANTATVTGSGPEGVEVDEGTDGTENETAEAAGVLSLEKSSELRDANGNGSADLGELIAYTFTVTNTGNLTMSDIVVDDPKLAAVGIGVICQQTELIPGASTVCKAEADYAVTQDDLLAGAVLNQATVGGEVPPGGGEGTDGGGGNEIDTTEPAGALTMVKQDALADLNGNGTADLGEQIGYSFDLTNTGNVTLTDVRVDDPMLAAAGIAVTCPVTTLEPGEQITCTADQPYTVTEADLVAGSVSNTATATGSTPDGVDEGTGTDGTDGTETETTSVDSRLVLDKQAELIDLNSSGLADEGEQVAYTFTLTNIGNVTITDVTVDDPMLAAAGIGVTCEATAVAPGQSVVCLADAPYTVTQQDVIDGGVVNTATAPGTGPTGPGTDGEDGYQPAEDEVLVPSPVAEPSLVLTKQAELIDLDGDGLASAGEQVAYTFTLVNNGNVTLTDVVVDDPKLAEAGISVVCAATTLAPGESTWCEAETPYTVTEQDIVDGAVRNSASASATTPDGVDPMTPGTDEVEVPTEQADPRLTMVKEATHHDANGDGVADAGETVDYTFTVTNIGNVTISDITIDDPKLADAGIGITCPVAVLVPGDSTVCVADTAYTVTEADLISGAVTNSATVPGTSPGGVDELEPPTGEVELPTPDAEGALTLEKSAVLRDTDGDGLADVDEVIDYSFLVTNTGNVTLTDVRVDDAMLAAAGIGITCPVSVLAPGEQVTCTADAGYVVSAEDAGAGWVTNTASADATTPDGVGVVSPPSDTVGTQTGEVYRSGVLATGVLATTGATVTAAALLALGLLGLGVVLVRRRSRA